jgi:hypothetical protein
MIMADRYTKVVLTIIACALVYLCVVVTAFPAAYAQQTAPVPGQSVGPDQVVIVGVTGALPVNVQSPVPVVNGSEPLRITGSVTTERSGNAADRVVLVGWEQDSVVEKPRPKSFRAFPIAGGLPVTQQ